MARCPLVRLPLLLAVITVAVAGCATAPSGGAPRQATGGGSQVQAYVQPLPPPPPTSSWGPTAVVLGFLHASASFAFDPSAARQYLAPTLRKSWHPASHPVAVVGALPTKYFSVAPYKPQLDLGVKTEEVTFNGPRLATLSPTGQYQYAPGQSVPYQFILAKTNGVWLIQSLPAGQLGLLLTESDFDQVYQARNLFFYAPPPATQQPTVLVPDPVYAPLQSSNSALNTNLATGLVKGLLQGQGDWLSGATWSAFPARTRLLKQVTIAGRVAQVDLGGAAAHANGLQLQLMEAQLRATLGDRSYSTPLANEVQLYINDVPQTSDGAASSGATLVPPVPSGPILIVTKAGGVGQLPDSPHADAVPAPRVSPAQIGRAAITAIAAEPMGGRTPPIALAVPDQAGCGIYLTSSGQETNHFYPLAPSGGTCTSLSWDNNGNVWATAGRAVWVLPATSRHAVGVDMTALAAVDQAGSRLQALQIAPDGVRAALLVHTPKSGDKLLLSAVHFDHGAVAFGRPVSLGIGAADPTAISWLDAFHLAVLAGTPGAMFEIPLIGGTGLQPGGPLRSIGSTPAGAQTLTTDGSELVVGTVDGAIYASSPASLGWIPVTTGSDPVYPG